MKNFLWFLHKPTDEREQLLYMKVYKRVLYFLLGIFVFGSLVIGLSTLFGIFNFEFENKVFSSPVLVFDIAIDCIFLICIFLGWQVLRKEELDSLDEKITHKQNIWVILFSLVFVLILSFFATQIFPQWYIAIYVFGFVVAWLLLSVFSWRTLTKKVPLLLRIYLSLVYPLFVLVFSRRSSKISVIRFILSCIYILWLHILLLAGFLFAVLFTDLVSKDIAPPHGINTNHFAPDFQTGDTVSIQESFESLLVNDFVIFLGSTGRPEGGRQPRLGKVISIEPSIVVDSSIGEVKIEKDDIFGKVTSKINIANDLWKWGHLPITIVTDGEEINYFY